MRLRDYAAVTTLLLVWWLGCLVLGYAGARAILWLMGQL